MSFLWIIFFALLSFFFSGSETALTSLPDYKLRKIYFKYKFLREPLTLWITKPYRILISILIGNTIVNLMLSSTSTDFFISYLPNVNKEIKELLIWFLTTFIVIIFCELTPKIISKNFPEKFSSVAIIPIWLFQYIIFFVFSPILYFFEKKLSKSDKIHFTKIEEIKRVLSDSARHIFQRKDVIELFDNATKFNEIRIKDISIPKNKVFAVDISNKRLQEVIEEVIEGGRTRVPVYNGNMENIVGYILIKDLFYVCYSEECTISEIIHPILSVNYNEKAKNLLKKMQNEQIHIAAVFDDNNKFYGIVTLEDILEELVGDILDEYDTRVIVNK